MKKMCLAFLIFYSVFYFSVYCQNDNKMRIKSEPIIEAAEDKPLEDKIATTYTSLRTIHDELERMHATIEQLNEQYKEDGEFDEVLKEQLVRTLALYVALKKTYTHRLQSYNELLEEAAEMGLEMSIE